jgi:hypothetical protein
VLLSSAWLPVAVFPVPEWTGEVAKANARSITALLVTTAPMLPRKDDLWIGFIILVLSSLLSCFIALGVSRVGERDIVFI